MPAPNVSRQALRHLSQLCRSAELFAPTSHQTIHRSIYTRCITSTQIQKQTQGRSTSKTQTQPAPPAVPTSLRRTTQTRSFTSTNPRAVQPSSNEPETDPQNTATPTLPDITNYYTLFPLTLPDGIPGPSRKEQSPSQSSSSSPVPFSIHTPTLRKEFLRLQSQHHPDKYTTSSPAHQKALALSAFINAAYKTLSDPLSRAQYLLQLQYDIDVMSEDNAAHPTDQETLMEVMEAQERVEGAETQEQVDTIKQENEVRMLETEKKMGDAFESGDAEVAKSECVRLKYWKSLQGALDEWEPGKEVRLIH